MELLIQLLVNGLISSSLYALLAVGFGIVYRSLKFFHIAYGGIYLVASYTAIFFVQNLNLSIYFSMLTGLLMAVLISIFIEKTVYLPFERKNTGSGVLFVVSLGIFIVLQNLIAMIFGNDIKALDFPVEGSFSLGSIIVTKIQILQFFTGIIVVLIFWLLTKKNTFFKALWAMGDNPELIRVLGYPYHKMRILVFSLSAVFVSIGSVLTTIDIGIDPNVGMKALLIGAIAVIVGGINSFFGWVLGAFFLGMFEAVSVWKFSSNWSELITYTLLILTLLFKPEGLISVVKRRG
ncbi:branched-chain amino acid ABC transporter permease [Persephonella sp.]